ncbi:MAG: permease-like cell division protein FtsX [Subdoligranulum sp.]|nr:permease-like cell division protein FtsX [Subdoligranulum sp.]MCI7542247.1 permease-like cell division protein FtsX [Subdoligranulum sp.]MDD7265071.1 permease-like cell division protein FtsX [Subdoligranulum sp.]MDY5923294.1 permease-like cell division protein FtsX [Oscillospiraceae bacterium]
MKWSSFKYLVRQGIHSLGTHSMMTFASIGVLTVCLVLTGIAYLFSVNVDSLIDYLGSQNETVVYLNPDLNEEQTAAVDTAIRSISGVSGVEYVSKEDVLSTYKGYMSEQYADLWDAFDNDNPFKANYRVTVKDLDDIQRISDELSAIEGVDSVSAPLAMSNVFVQVQDVVTFAGYGLVAVLAVVAVVVISNTIRITVFARRREINIMKYVGATNGFIRLPFFVEGMAAGLISAFIASVIVLGGYWVLTYYSDLVPGFWRSLLSESVVPVTDVWYKVVPAFAAFSVLMGGVGSLVSIRKHLDV